MLVPLQKNIRWHGFSKPQRFNVAIPPVYAGDWLASRNGKLYFYRTPWDAGPFVAEPALSNIRQAVLKGVGLGGVSLKGLGALGYNDLGAAHGCTYAVCASSSDKPTMQSRGCSQRSSTCSPPSGGQVYCCPSSPSSWASGGGAGGADLPTISSILEEYGVSSNVQAGTGGSSMTCRTSSRSGGSSYWREVQQRLCNLGYDPGTIDGVLGGNTQRAIRAFQTANSITASGAIDSATASILGVSTSSGQTTGRAGGGTSRVSGGGEEPTVTTAGLFTDFFNLRNPLFWLMVAGFLLTGVGVSYGYAKHKAGGRERAEGARQQLESARSEYAAGLGEMSDSELERYMMERAAEAGVLSAPKKVRKSPKARKPRARKDRKAA